MDIIESAQKILRSYGDMPADETIRKLLAESGWDMSTTTDMLTVADYDYWPQEVRDWLTRVGWREVDDFSFQREILPDGFVEGAHGQRWAKWKLGPHVTVTAFRGAERKQQQFIIDGVSWYPVREEA